MIKAKQKKVGSKPIVLPVPTVGEYAAYTGIDWADRKHDISLYDCETQTVEHVVIGSQPESIEAWAEGLRQRFSGQAIAIALEQKRGPLIYALCNRRMLVGEKVRLTNRITDALNHSFPQVLDWFEDKDTYVFCTFLERYPALSTAQAASQDELEQFFRSHHVVQAKTIKRRLEQIQQGVPPTHDIGIVEPLQLLVKVLTQQLTGLLTSIAEFDAKIESVFAALPDAAFFAALPAAGPKLAPRLLVAFGDDRTRYASAQDLLRYCGIAPVTESSGQQSWTHWRWACPKFLRQTFVEWANQTRQDSFWAEAFYQSQRARGKTHQMAIRALAFKWIRIVWRCWQDRKPYDEAKYLMALKKKGSPLVQQLVL